MAKLISYNPSNGEKVGENDISTENDIKAAVTKAKQAFLSWKNIPIRKRSEYIKKFSVILKNHQEDIAQLTSREMGKPIREALDDIGQAFVQIVAI